MSDRSVRGTVVMRAALIVMAVAQVGYVTALIVVPEPTFIVDVVLSIASQWAAVLVFATVAGRSGFRRGELLLALAAVAFSAFGDTYYAIAADADGYLPSPSLADAGYLLFYPLMVAAIIVIARRRTQQRLGIMVVLDGVVAALGAAALIALLLSPVLRAAVVADAPLDGVFAVLYPALDLLLIAVVSGIAASPVIDLGAQIGRAHV